MNAIICASKGIGQKELVNCTINSNLLPLFAGSPSSQKHSYKQPISGLVDAFCQQKVGIPFPAISFIYAVFLCVVNCCR